MVPGSGCGCSAWGSVTQPIKIDNAATTIVVIVRKLRTTPPRLYPRTIYLVIDLVFFSSRCELKRLHLPRPVGAA